MKTIYFLNLIFVLSLLGGCALAPKKFTEYKEGQWSGKVLVNDKKAEKKGIVNVSIKAIDQEKLRMDVTAPLGDHLVSFLMTGDKLEYLNVKEKEFVTSKPSREAFRDVLKVPLDPVVFYNVLFDRPIETKNWSCASDKGYLKTCKDIKSGVTIEWVLREGENRTIKIEHSTASLQINLNDFHSAVDAKETVFTLKAPKNFKLIKR